MAGIVDLRVALQTAIGSGVTVNLGEAEKWRSLVAPQFIITPRYERYTTPQGPGASGNPRLLHTRRLSFELDVWGPSYAATEDMFAGFITALRVAVQGANYEIEDGTWEEPKDLSYGVHFICNITAVFGLAQKTLPVAVPLSWPDGTYPTTANGQPRSSTRK